MIRPRRLPPGGRVAVVAPASAFAREDFDRGIAELRSLGFEPVVDESVFARDGYVAGPADVRVRAFQTALLDPSIDAIFAARGGFGSAHLLPLLDPDMVRRARKLFVGYSDLTSLLTFFTTTCGVAAVHGPTVVGRLSRGEAGYDRRSLLDVTTVAAPAGELTSGGLEALRAGEARGPIFGGNLTQLGASLGTPFAFAPPPGYVLFIEDVGERPYRLDRLLTQFAQAGLLARTSAIVVGEMVRCDEPSGEPSARAVIADLLKEFRGPVLFGFPSGHTEAAALTLPLGVAVRVVAGPRSCLVVEEAAVE